MTPQVVDHYTFKDALGSSDIKPGDRLLLRAGTYSGPLISSIAGTVDAPIIIEPYNNGVVIIDGTVQVYGAYTTWRGLRMFDSAFVNRESAQGTDSPADVSPRTGFSIEANAHGTKLIGCDIHDYGGGIGKAAGAQGCEFFENIVRHCGWKNPSNAYGHGHYFQNAAGIVSVKRNIVFDQFGYAFHLFGAATNGLVMHDNVMFCAGSLERPTYRPNFLLENGTGLDYQRNISWFPGAVSLDKFGYDANDVVAGVLRDNYFAGQLVQFNGIPDLTVTGNSFCGTQSFDPEAYADNYYGAAQDRVYVVATEYRGKAIVTVINPSQAEAVEVDVSSLFADGVQVTAQNAQDYYVDIQTLTVTAGKITVNMQAINRTVATPIGWTAPATTFPLFGCFVLSS